MFEGLNYKWSFSWFVETVFPIIGTFFGYLIAFGEMDTVSIDYLLTGHTFSWEVLNIFTNESEIIYIYSYRELFNLLLGAFSEPPIVISALVNLFINIFSVIGHTVYVLLFGLPVALPLWVSLLVVVPRFLILVSLLKFFKHFISEVLPATK